jgi:predicted transcriptional regulator YdeE
MEYYIINYKARHYAGVMAEGGISLISLSERKKIKETWRYFYDDILAMLPERVHPEYYIGLDWYGDDYHIKKAYDYMVLAQVTEEFEGSGDIIYRKLPEGNYIIFPTTIDSIKLTKSIAYNLVIKKNITIDTAFEYIEYLPDQNYSDPDAIIHFCMKLIEVH